MKLNKIGNTPLIELKNINKNNRIFAKIEGKNPSGSIKDRAVLYMLEKAKVPKNKTLIEASSGNTGISLSWIGREKGYNVEIVMPEAMSEEKKNIIQSYGAKLIFSPRDKPTDYAVNIAKEILKKKTKKYFMLDQFSNPEHVNCYYNILGKEIVDYFKNINQKINYFVAGVGSGGTIMGVGKRLKEEFPNIKIIAVEPKQAVHNIEGLHNNKAYEPYPIYDVNFPDKTIRVSDKEAYSTALKIKDLGILVGPSSGAVLSACLKLKGNIITIFPDNMDRYKQKFKQYLK